MPVGLTKKKPNTKSPRTSHSPLRRSLRLARPENTNMADATDNVVDNTQKSACASSQYGAGDDQLHGGVGNSATNLVGDTTTDTRKRPNATSPTKVPTYMCISFKYLEMGHLSLCLILAFMHVGDDGVQVVTLACILLFVVVLQMAASMFLSMWLV